MGTWEWVEGAIRLFTVISMGASAVRGFRRARQQGFARTAVVAITAWLFLLYLVGGVLLIAGYFIFEAPAHAVPFGLLAIAYVAGGFMTVGKIGGYLESRLTRTVRWPG
jgi:hypothetical protein